MKGHITTDGYLSIFRGEKYVPQICPFGGDDSMCGDHCPLFGEPSDIEEEKGMAFLPICKTDLKFIDFKDYRINPKGAKNVNSNKTKK